jgi:hypothetical protein
MNTTIEVRFGSVLVTIDVDYRPWTADPDPWEVHLRPHGSGDWLCSRPAREARFSTDILDLASGVTTHDVVLILTGVPHLPGLNPFFKGQSGVGTTGPVSSIDSLIPAGARVSWKVIKGSPSPTRPRTWV